VNKPAAALVISEGQRETLTVLARSQTAPHRQVQRAEALLHAADGVANTRIAARVGVNASTVRAWRARFAEDGLAKLGKVREGRGRKSTIPQDKIDEIVELTQHSKPDGQTALVVSHDGQEGRGIASDGTTASGPRAGSNRTWFTRSSCPTIRASRRS